MLKIKVEEEGIKQIRGFLGAADEAKMDLDLPGYAITVFGAFTMTNFQKRGMEFGRKWQPISEYTKEVREMRGQNPLAPPLRPGGTNWLYNTSAVALANWPRQSAGRSFVDSGHYPGKPSDGPTAMLVTSTPMHATIKMAGAKVAHMFDDISKTNVGLMQYKRSAFGARGGGDANRYGRGYVPARPFWGVNRRMTGVMADAVVSALFVNWADRTQKAGLGRPTYSTESVASLRARAL